jgi:hypothetical protein
MSKSKSTSAFTYIIIDKRDESVQMVGTTIDLKGRWISYRCNARNAKKRCTWNPVYTHMCREGIDNFELHPVLEFPFAEYGGREGAQAYGFAGEECYVAKLRQLGFELFNIAKGGRGGAAYTGHTHSEEIRATLGRPGFRGPQKHPHGPWSPARRVAYEKRYLAR